MSEESFNMSLRKFLKTVGVTSQRQIEDAVRAAESAGSAPAGKVSATVVLTIGDLNLTHEITGDIDMPGST